MDTLGAGLFSIAERCPYLGDPLQRGVLDAC